MANTPYSPRNSSRPTTQPYSPRNVTRPTPSSPRFCMSVDEGKAYKQDLIKLIMGYLKTKSFPYNISAKDLHTPSKSTYLCVMDFIWKQIDPSLVIPINNYEDVLARLFKMFGYNGLTKSILKSFSSQSSWVFILQGMAYLVVVEGYDSSTYPSFPTTEEDTASFVKNIHELAYGSNISVGTWRQEQIVSTAFGEFNRGSMTESECVYSLAGLVKEQLKEIDSDIGVLEAEEGRMEHKRFELQTALEEFNKLRSEIEAQHNEIARIDQVNSVTQSKLQEWTNDNERLCNEIACHDTRVDALQAEVRALERELELNQEELERAQSLQYDSSIEKAELKNAQNSRKEYFVTLAELQAAADIQNSDLKEAVNRIKVHLEELFKYMNNDEKRMKPVLSRLTPSVRTSQAIEMISSTSESRSSLNKEPAVSNEVVNIMLGVDLDKSTEEVLSHAKENAMRQEELEKEVVAIDNDVDIFQTQLNCRKSEIDIVKGLVAEHNLKSASPLQTLQNRIAELVEKGRFLDAAFVQLDEQLPVEDLRMDIEKRIMEEHIKKETRCEKHHENMNQGFTKLVYSLYKLHTALQTQPNFEKYKAFWTEIQDKLLLNPISLDKGEEV